MTSFCRDQDYGIVGRKYGAGYGIGDPQYMGICMDHIEASQTCMPFSIRSAVPQCLNSQLIKKASKCCLLTNLDRSVYSANNEFQIDSKQKA